MSVVLTGPPEHLDAAHLDIALFEARARRILDALDDADSELSLAIVDDTEIRDLNARFRDKDRATDVLSFSLLEGDHADFRGGLLGDVVISLETARRQARARHRALDDEMARLLIHGVLHLLGHDHERDDEARAMRAEERRLWKALQP